MKPGSVEIGTRNYSIAEIRRAEISLSEIGSPQLGPPEISPPYSSCAEPGFTEVGSSQRRLWHPHLFQISLPEESPVQFNASCIEGLSTSFVLTSSKRKEFLEDRCQRLTEWGK